MLVSIDQLNRRYIQQRNGLPEKNDYVYVHLTLSTLGNIFNRRHIEIIFLFFSRKQERKIRETSPICRLLNCLLVFKFYGPVNPMGSCRARSVYLTTRLLGRLSPLSG